MTRPPVIALIGIDGAGKSTQARLLAAWLTERGVPALALKNPGGRLRLNRIARALGRTDAIRLLGRGGFGVVEILVRWLMLARAVVWSMLARQVVVMDRYTYCQYAALRARRARGERAARWAYSGFPRPDLVCFLATSPAVALDRVNRRGTDTEELAYLAALDAAYRSLPETAGFTVIDADGSLESVQDALRDAVAQRMAAVAS